MAGSRYQRTARGRLHHAARQADTVSGSTAKQGEVGELQSGISNENYFVDGRPASKATYKAAQILSEGLALLTENHNQDALLKFEQAIRLDPGLAEARHNRAHVLMLEGNSSEAIETFEATLRLKDTIDSTWLSLGALYQSTGRLDDAIAAYNEFLKRFPSSDECARVRNLLPMLEYERGRLFEANQNAEPFRMDYYAEVTQQGIRRWHCNSMPISVFVHSTQSMPPHRTEFDTILRESFVEWSSTSQGHISFEFVDNPKHAQLFCMWKDDPARLTNRTKYGETTVDSQNNCITGATIKLLNASLSPQLPLSLNRVRACCLHEIGHALGLNGHSGDPGDIMFYASQLADDKQMLSQRDRNTVLRLYGNDISG